MTITIKKGDSIEKINKQLTKLGKKASKKGLDAMKFCGTINLKEDPLEIQKRMRDEWQ